MAQPSIADLVQQRSMLVILIAACRSAMTAFEAADNVIDAELRGDLSKMIAADPRFRAPTQLTRDLRGKPRR